MFPASEVEALRGHTCARAARVDWYLVVDKYEFHVYVGLLVRFTEPPAETVQARIDWHQDSTLTFRPFVFDALEQAVPVGSGVWFCRACTQQKLEASMLRHQYRLFRYNCRTLSYLVLVQVARFEPTAVYAQFERLRLMCGLEPRECLALVEVHRYFAWRAGQPSESGHCALS